MNTRRRTAAVLASSLILGLASCEELMEETFDEDMADTLPKNTVLDVEYKKLEGNKLIIKQIRPVPQPDDNVKVPPFLLKRSRRVCTVQGEGDNVFASHRIKAIIGLDSRSVRLTAANMKLPLLARIDAQINALDGSIVEVAGEPAMLPQAEHQVLAPPLGFSGKLVTDGWTIGAGAAERVFALALNLGEPGPPSASPVTLLEDARTTLTATYSTPAPTLVLDFDNGGFKPATQTEERSELGTCPEDVALEETIQHRELHHGSVTIDTQFRYAASPADVLIKTSSLGQWVETKISGLTTQPIVLRGFFSQTFEPAHHNFLEHFVFEPALEPGIPAAQLQELAAKDIRQIVVMNSAADTTEKASYFKLGSSGKYEPLP